MTGPADATTTREYYSPSVHVDGARDTAAPISGSAAFHNESPEERYQRCRAHVIARVEATPVGTEPFHHAFVEDVFPHDLSEAVRSHMLTFKHGDKVQDRHQDNPAFMNKRYNLVDNHDPEVAIIRGIFSDPEVKRTLLAKFYAEPTRELADALAIHNEFEYTFTQGGRFQNIHVDIPPKFMSFVFYIPEIPIAAEEEDRNATILYDKSLSPHYKARFKANSVCMFVPHFYSYHGFASTIDRDVLVMFYINGEYMQRWQQLQQHARDEPPYEGLLDSIEAKLRSFPLKEYQASEDKLREERACCLVNAPKGRVLM